VVLVVTAGARAATLPLFEPPYRTDVKEYVEKAEAIADDGTPRRQEVKPDGRIFYRPLGSSLALAGWYRLTGTRGLLSARVHGIVLACAAAWLLLVLGRTIGRETEGRLAALGYATLLSHAVFATIPYTETFTTVLVLGISIAFERVRRDLGGSGAAAALGLLGGWLTITRTELVMLPLLALLLLLWERRREWTEALAPCAVAGVLFLVPLAVNYDLRAGYPGTLRTSCQGGLILYFGNNPIEVNGYGNATPAVQAAVEAMRVRDPSGDLARDAALGWMAEHPGEVLLNSPKKAFHLWLAEPQGFGWHAAAGRPPAEMERTTAAILRSAAYVQSLLILVAGLAGRRLLGAERRLWTWTLVVHLGAWCLLAASARNRYPLEPWLLLAAAAHVRRTG
jgi:4-amino-4-deoxy-L-arabinose transferase-like glycosyltransferase